MSLARTPARMLARHGERWTLRRATSAAGPNAWTLGAQSVAYYEQRAMRRIGDPTVGSSLRDDVRGLARDAQAVVILSPNLTEPQQGDHLTQGDVTGESSIEWLEVVFVEVIRVQGQTAKYYAHVRGGVTIPNATESNFGTLDFSNPLNSGYLPVIGA